MKSSKLDEVPGDIGTTWRTAQSVALAQQSQGRLQRRRMHEPGVDVLPVLC